MNYLNYINMEGGPLLIADASVCQQWYGVEDDGADYLRACKIFHEYEIPLPGYPIDVGTGQGIVWDVHGAGTVHVFMNDVNGLTLIRAWIHEPRDFNTISALAEFPYVESITIGYIVIVSNTLCLLWSAESGECITTLEIVHSARPHGEMAIDTAGLLVPLADGSYNCIYDEVSLEDGQKAIRCHLMKI